MVELRKHGAELMGLSPFHEDHEEEVIKKDLGKVQLKLQELQEEQIRKTLEPRGGTGHLRRWKVLFLLKVVCNS